MRFWPGHHRDDGAGSPRWGWQQRLILACGLVGLAIGFAIGFAAALRPL